MTISGTWAYTHRRYLVHLASFPASFTATMLCDEANGACSDRDIRALVMDLAYESCSY